ncbi:hypothetical protein GM608_07805 [Bombella sp. ESL0380]|uniref:hypothetical protein n=1 Tax=Bombella sp. ESL0380 TaxID=2676444 RepID=UPI00139D07C4|nr:hypothetical protein [Bombella sp. ESL0380]
MTAGLPVPLQRDRQPVERLYPGWQCNGRHPAPAGMEVLSLQHRHTGQEACWWLTPEGDILACHALALDKHWSQKIREAVAPALQQLSTTLLGRVTPLPAEACFPHEAMAPLTNLPHTARLQLLGLWFRSVSRSLLVLSPATLLDGEETSLELEAADATGQPFAPRFIRAMLETRPAGPHTLACSPFSGRIIRAELTMPTDRGVACRFSDERNGETFYLFWPGPAGQIDPQTTQQPLFYHPQGELLLGDGPLTPLVPIFLLSWFISNPNCIEELKHAHPFRLEDYGVGKASALWKDIALAPSSSQTDTQATTQEETGQNRTSFPFSSRHWGQSFFFEAGRTAGLPDRDRLTPQDHEKTTGAGHENHDEP